MFYLIDRWRQQRLQVIDASFFALILTAAIVASLIMLLIIGFLAWESWDFIRNYGLHHFLSGDGWWPLEQQFNLMPMIVASLIVTLGSVVISTPLAIIYAVFSVYYAPHYAKSSLYRLIDIVAAIPTVIYGFWGLMVLVPLINMIQPPGASLLAGMLVLAMMVFPTIAILTISALKAVPLSYIQGSTALGIGKLSFIRKISLPTARPGIVMAIVLGITRAIGETMVVLMVCGNVIQMPGSLFDAGRALTANIALEMPYAMGDHRSSLFVTGLTVLAVVIVLVIVCELLTRHSQKGIDHAIS